MPRLCPTREGEPPREPRVTNDSAAQQASVASSAERSFAPRDGRSEARLETKPSLSVGQAATLACLWEVSVPKPGNVHRGADFEDLTFFDFVTSAVAIAPAMEMAAGQGIGAAVLEAVRATRAAVSTNTNLGTILLLAPLAAVRSDLDEVTLDAEQFRSQLEQTLQGLGSADAEHVYEAIRLAQPGGLDEVDEMDVADEAPDDLLAAMRAAAARDLVARQYTNGFAEVFEVVVPWIGRGLAQGWHLAASLVHAHVQLMAAHPDSLIARKCGAETAATACRRAAAVLSAGEPGDEAYERGLGDLDFWLRSDGHRRNPGTTADLIAASLFVMLRIGLLDTGSMTHRVEVPTLHDA
ncbi:MAG: triphosphoribosyl-dephospho-CoA synthetase [Planctomycetota bacterium]|nr:MAG: triphosphoribosyl-dephospho-CoA synthetase [Planctomycetota bacterium]